MSDWDSRQYVKFESERTRPATDLISRIDINPQKILDIGCGPGNSTNQLCRHFPSAYILGIDSSDDMLARAKSTYKDLTFQKCAVPSELQGLGSFDLIFSNACLHWIPNHAELLPKLTDKLNGGGMLAVQVPFIQKAAFYQTLNKLLLAEKWKDLSSITLFHNLSPDEYYDILSEFSSDIKIWETTYYHVLPSHGDIINWYTGSGLRPYLDRLGREEKDVFLRELLKRIEADFPLRADGSVILKMPRLFFTAVKHK